MVISCDVLIVSNPRIRSNLISLHGPRQAAARDQLIRGNERHVCMYVKLVAFYVIHCPYVISGIFRGTGRDTMPGGRGGIQISLSLSSS